MVKIETISTKKALPMGVRHLLLGERLEVDQAGQLHRLADELHHVQLWRERHGQLRCEAHEHELQRREADHSISVPVASAALSCAMQAMSSSVRAAEIVSKRDAVSFLSCSLTVIAAPHRSVSIPGSPSLAVL